MSSPNCIGRCYPIVATALLVVAVGCGGGPSDSEPNEQPAPSTESIDVSTENAGDADTSAGQCEGDIEDSGFTAHSGSGTIEPAAGGTVETESRPSPEDLDTMLDGVNLGPTETQTSECPESEPAPVGSESGVDDGQ